MPTEQESLFVPKTGIRTANYVIAHWETCTLYRRHVIVSMTSHPNNAKDTITDNVKSCIWPEVWTIIFFPHSTSPLFSRHGVASRGFGRRAGLRKSGVAVTDCPAKREANSPGHDGHYPDIPAESGQGASVLGQVDQVRADGGGYGGQDNDNNEARRAAEWHASRSQSSRGEEEEALWWAAWNHWWDSTQQFYIE